MADEERKQIEVFRGSLNGLNIALKNKKVLYAELRSQLEAIINEIQSERKSTLNLRNEIDILKAEVSKAKSNSIHFEKKFREFQEKQNTAATLVRQTEANLQQQIQACSQYCSRIEVKRTEEEIDRELSKLNALLKEKERRFGSRELFYNKLSEKRDIYRNAMKEMNDFAELMEYIASARRIRSRKLESFKKYISIRAKRIFSSLIQKRGYRGVLELDHEAGTLGLRVFFWFI
jgi:DNA repair exonuclease SbcCD ATPase subunit